MLMPQNTQTSYTDSLETAKIVNSVRSGTRAKKQRIALNNPAQQQLQNFFNTLNSESKKLVDAKGFIDTPANRLRQAELQSASSLVYAIQDEIKGSAGVVTTGPIFKEIGRLLSPTEGILTTDNATTITAKKKMKLQKLPNAPPSQMKMRRLK
jgi:hypothetical protein